MNNICVLNQTVERVKSAIAIDKHFKPNKLCDVIKSEVYMTLIEYAEIKPDDFNIKVTVNEFGDYVINICAIARKLKIIGIVPDKL